MNYISFLWCSMAHDAAPENAMPSSPSEPAPNGPILGGPVLYEPAFNETGAGLIVSSDSLELRPRNWLKRLLPQSMFGRSLMLIIIPLVLVQIIAAIVFYARHWEAVSYRLSADVAGDIELVIEALDKAAASAERQAIFDKVARVAELIVSFEPGATLPEYPPVGGSTLESQLQKAMVKRVARPFALDAAANDRYVLVAVQLGDGLLLTHVPFSRLYTPTTYIFILWMVGSSLILLGVAGVFLRNQVRSLRRLAAAADGFGKGRPVVFTKVEGALEVRQAAAAFIRMRDRIERQIRQRTEMLAGVSHDLRTPLTRMKLALALIGDDAVAAELNSDVAEMERLVNSYLDFARGEGIETPIESDIWLLIEDMAAAARRDGTKLTVVPGSELILSVRPNALRRCLGNLIANARRYGKHVWLSAAPADDGIDILVDDDGPGIPELERERVFRPFIRLDASRNLATGGVGLGLTIARDMARSHGGDIRLETSPFGGLRARIHLPR
jgi:two-component system osmolarity sensor histidine kinase EnvZ